MRLIFFPDQLSALPPPPPNLPRKSTMTAFCNFSSPRFDAFFVPRLLSSSHHESLRVVGSLARVIVTDNIATNATNVPTFFARQPHFHESGTLIAIVPPFSERCKHVQFPCMLSNAMTHWQSYGHFHHQSGPLPSSSQFFCRRCIDEVFGICLAASARRIPRRVKHMPAFFI